MNRRTRMWHVVVKQQKQPCHLGCRPRKNYIPECGTRGAIETAGSAGGISIGVAPIGGSARDAVVGIVHEPMATRRLGDG